MSTIYLIVVVVVVAVVISDVIAVCLTLADKYIPNSSGNAFGRYCKYFVEVVHWIFVNNISIRGVSSSVYLLKINICSNDASTDSSAAFSFV